MIKKRFISMLVLLMAVVTGAWAQEESLLTTIESTGDNASFESGSKTFDNIATVTFSGAVYNDDDEWGWYSEEGTLTVTAAEGYTITRVKFYNDSGSAFDEGAPFEAILVTDEVHYPITKVNGTSLGNNGVTKIEVYGYANAPATVAVTGVTLSPTSATLTLGETETVTLTATVLPDNATDKSVTWTTSDAAVATVANGVVTAVGAGTATITVTTTDGAFTATCAVTVAAPVTYTVSMKESTEDATSWQGKAGEGEYQSLPLTGLEAGTAVSVKYSGTKKVKSVKAKKKAAAAPATGHALSASQVGEIVCSDGLAYAAADKDNLPTGVTAVAIVAYLGDGDTSDNTYNNGLAIAMTNANDGSGCGWGDWGATYHCVSESNDIATAIGYKDGISSTNTLTSDGHYHEAATAAASNNGTAAPTGTSGWFLPSIGQWNLIVQGLASKKAGSAVTTDITKFDENDTYKASNLNSVITDAGGTGFNGDYHSSTQFDGEECWHMSISSGRAWSYGFSAGDYVRSVLAF